MSAVTAKLPHVSTALSNGSGTKAVPLEHKQLTLEGAGRFSNPGIALSQKLKKLKSSVHAGGAATAALCTKSGFAIAVERTGSRARRV